MLFLPARETTMGANNIMEGTSDEDFDRLWDKAFIDAIEKQGLRPRDRPDPVEHTNSRHGWQHLSHAAGARHSRPPPNNVSSKKQLLPKQQQKLARGKTSSQVPQIMSEEKFKPKRCAAPESLTQSSRTHQESTMPAEKEPAFNPFRNNRVTFIIGSVTMKQH